MNLKGTQLCGIDEAGRGPLAGPLVMAGVILTDQVEGLMDSKKLSEKKREILYPQIINASRYHIVVFTHAQIDEQGISYCLHEGLEQIKASLPDASYLFDGNSTFGVESIETMIKADAKIPEVSAASILAKVTRDRVMKDYALDYPEYGFEKHKGYGTAAHVEAMRKYGRCAIHRHTFRVKALDEILGTGDETKLLVK
ncbi:MAG: ribonuclease HII [Epsilonproteobacteria bacterium]|nr:MAG: ribonuclease HII [Campylobacterota bacterium]